MTPNFFQVVTLEKIWVEATLKISQVAPYKKCGYILQSTLQIRVQIERAIFFIYLIPWSELYKSLDRQLYKQ